MNIFIITSLQNILATYQSIVAYFYQNIVQSEYTNNQLATYPINYALLLPASQFQTDLSANQVNAQIQAYITQCNLLIVFITTTIDFQTNLFYEQIQNQLNNSITQLNGFATALLNAAASNLFAYTIPYDMGLSTALQLNNLSLNTYPVQARLNYDLPDFNNLLKDTQITLSRGQ